MAQIAISNRPCTPVDILGDNATNIDDFCSHYRVPHRGLLPPARAFSTDAFNTQADAVVTQLNALPPDTREQLGSCINEFGDVPTRQLAEFYYRNLERPLSQVPTLIGAGTTAMTARNDGFRAALAQYQDALLDLYEHRRGGGPPGVNRTQLEARVRRAYANLDRQFRVEMDRIVPAVDRGKNRGSALTSAERGITLANRGGRRRINLQNLVDASRVGRLAQGIQHVGRGLVAVDIGVRAGRVRATREAGADWLRQTSQELTGFGIGGAAGLAAGKSTVGGLSSGLVLLGVSITPGGWLLLIGTGAAVGLAVGWGGDRVGRWAAGAVWNRGW